MTFEIHAPPLPEFSEALYAAIKERHANATPGPWDWYGNTDNDTVSLATMHSGITWIITFARMGMRMAAPVFRGQYYERPGATVKQILKRHVRYEVLGYKTRKEAGLHDHSDMRNSPLYREDFTGIDHPDAELIAHAPVDIGVLIAELDRVRNGCNCAQIARRMTEA